VGTVELLGDWKIVGDLSNFEPILCSINDEEKSEEEGILFLNKEDKDYFIIQNLKEDDF
jgi:hypothetical protein